MQGVVQPAKIVQSLVKAGREAQARALTVLEDLLKVAEQAPGAGQRKGHGPKLAQELVPGVEGQALARGRDRIKEGLKACKTSRGEGERHGFAIDYPAEKFFASGPGGIAFGELGNRNRLGAVWRVRGREGPKNKIDCVHEDPPSAIEAGGGALCDGNEVVDKNIKGAGRALVKAK